ncbi:porin family protein [uncultured Dokdonia sp.]|uniref:type IX secretion/gliding motility protein PorT/SprT n=1 Tax=uncultured Dokdonia sp. TaxID=575653 RepID=UPI0026375C34|nr:porin family protein [uncultured Dokdonia sp.]
MRVFIAIVFFLTFTQTSQAQWLTRSRVQNQQNFDKKPIRFGYYLGFNNYDYNFDYIAQQEDIEVTRSIGFNVGIVANLRLSDYIDLRTEPGLSFTRRDLLYAPDPRFDSEQDLIREVPGTYIYLPLLLKFNTKRLNNVRPFVTVGVSTTVNLSSNEKNPDDNFAGQFRTTTSPFFYEVGFGVELYLYFFKFTPSIRGVFATTDELVRDNMGNSPWTGNISKMSSRGVFLNFTFQ